MATNVSFTEVYPEHQSLTVPNDFGSCRYQGTMVRAILDHQPKNVALIRYRWDMTKRSLDGLSEFDPDSIDGCAVQYITRRRARMLIAELAPGCSDCAGMWLDPGHYRDPAE